jgi:hypothetical protein
VAVVGVGGLTFALRFVVVALDLLLTGGDLAAVALEVEWQYLVKGE